MKTKKVARRKVPATLRIAIYAFGELELYVSGTAIRKLREKYNKRETMVWPGEVMTDLERLLQEKK